MDFLSAPHNFLVQHFHNFESRFLSKELLLRRFRRTLYCHHFLPVHAAARRTRRARRARGAGPRPQTPAAAARSPGRGLREGPGVAKIPNPSAESFRLLALLLICLFACLLLLLFISSSFHVLDPCGGLLNGDILLPKLRGRLPRAGLR